MKPSFIFHTCTETLLYTQMFEQSFMFLVLSSVYHTFTIRTVHTVQHLTRARRTYAPPLTVSEGTLAHNAGTKTEASKVRTVISTCIWF